MDKHIKNVADEKAVENGCTYEPAYGEHVVKFFSDFLRHSKGQWAGQPFDLIDWQREDVVMPLFSWIRPDGARRFRRAYISMGKKQGKSTLCSGLALYGLTADDEAGAEVYSCASDRHQAGIIFGEAANMVERSPELQSILTVNRAVKTIVYPATQSRFVAISAEERRNEGLNAHIILFDELHTQRNRALWDALRYAFASRRQPLLIAVTTAGFDRHSICYEQYDYARKVLDGTIEDESFFAYIAEASQDDDWEDPATWHKANPSLGDTVSLESFKEDFLEAKESPAKELSFRRYRLNQWTTQETRWIPMDKWDACGEVFNVAALDGRSCYGGLDLAAKFDLSALVLLFPDGDVFKLLPFFWIPADIAEEREKRDRVPYAKWQREGHVIFTEGNVVDFETIQEFIKDASERYHIDGLAFDPWNAMQMGVNLDTFGIPAKEFPQSLRHMNEPSKEFERLIRAGKLRHNNHPVLRWMAGNVQVKTDASGNIRPVKPDHNAGAKVDGIISAIMATGLYLASPQWTGKSIYDEAGSLAL